MRCLIAAAVLLMAVMGGDVRGEAPIVFEAVEDSGKQMPTLAWVDDAKSDWFSGPALFDLSDEPDHSARGWAALTREHILLRVIVQDTVHHNTETGPDIWKGDSLQIAIDGRGDGAGIMSADTRSMFGPDDVALGFGLGANGPVGFVYFSQASGKYGTPVDSKCFTIRRDDTARTTTYDLRLPWSMLHTPGGAYPTLGLAVQINCSDPNQGEQSRLYFGRGADGMVAPGLHQLIRVPDPPFPCAYTSAEPALLWTERDLASAYVAVKSNEPVTLTVTLGESHVTRSIGGGKAIERVWVRARPNGADGNTARSFSVELHDEDKQVLAKTSELIVIPQTVFERLVDALETEELKAEHPLLARHLRSVRGLVQAEWARLQLYRDSDPALAKATVERLQHITQGLAHDAANWQTYLDGRRSLILALISKRDGTLQFYSLNLPKQWDPAKAYPLFVELHGAGDPNPLSTVARRVGGALAESPDLDGYATPQTYASVQRNGYHITPFARGNSGYRDIGETDVWEALADLESHFKIDPDRRYLYGFSMGAMGTWRLGARTPDRWAAIAIFAGRPGRNDSEVELGRNVSQLPVWIWCGEEDRFLAGTRAIRDEVAAHGPEPAYSSTPDIGHRYIGEKQKEALNWMQQFTRKRPDRFEFVADTPEHRGIWGVTLPFRPEQSGVPSFVCEIDGSTVTIDLKGADSVRVDLGSSGLGLDGPNRVVVNGVLQYEGPPETIECTIGPKPLP